MPSPTITNPRRILLVGAPNSGKLTFLKELTGSLPPTTQSQLSHAGLSHTLSLKTNYYEVDVPVWVDEWIEEGPAAGQPISTRTSITESTLSATGTITTATAATTTTTTTALTTSETISGPAPWAQNYHTVESKPVLSVIGGFILCFRKPPPGTFTSPASIPPTPVDAIRAVGGIIRACGSSWDGVALAVGMPSDGVIVGSPTGIGEIGGVGVWGGSVSGEEEEDLLSDLCQQSGFEYVDYEKKGRNDYGERQGLERVREALEANDWDNSGNDGDLDFYDDEDEGAADGDERGVLGSVAGEFEQEMFGLRQAIERGVSSGGGLDGLFGDLDEDGDPEDGEEGNEEDERKQVEDMERVMMRMAMLRDLGGEDEEQIKRERRKLAQELLREIMMEGEVLEGEKGEKEGKTT
ncbi:hypothetical protein EV426DRAFT_13762 [Tirmania nivea]|nr:hypothetical protein EV426DRAFT_13762 [Tirmania nivea]